MTMNKKTPPLLPQVLLVLCEARSLDSIADIIYDWCYAEGGIFVCYGIARKGQSGFVLTYWKSLVPEDLKHNIERDGEITHMVICDARSMPALEAILSSQRDNPLSEGATPPQEGR
jgi:hypothetical protein